MKQIMKYANPITQKDEYIELEINNLDERKWYNLEYILKDNQIEALIDSLQPKIYKNELYFDTKSFAYIDTLVILFRILYRINDYILYNKIFDNIIKKHQDNLIFEYEFYNYIKMKEGKKIIKTQTSAKPKSHRNIWVMHETKDIFNEKTIYLYENLYTGESLESNNPNMLEELNAKLKEEKKKKAKEKKVIPFDMSTISFKFNL